MINGTNLLRVTGITRERRDGILKSERVRHVVKIGPVHLKGVWIPFERALDFANKEKITEMLYPLFVQDIGTLLYHPTNQTKSNRVMENLEGRPEAPSESMPQISNSDSALLASLRDPGLEPIKATSIGVLDEFSSTPSLLASNMGQQHMYLTQMRLDSDSSLTGNSLTASWSGSFSPIGGPYHRMDRPYPQRSTLTPPPNDRSHMQRGHYLLTPSTSGSSASGAKTPEKDQRHKLEVGSDRHADVQYYYTSTDSGLDNVKSMPILPPASTVNDQDEKSSPNQLGSCTLGPDSENVNEATVATSIRERPTKIMSPVAKREVEVEEGYSSSNEKKYVVSQSPSAPQSDTIGMDDDDDTPEAPAQRKYTHMQVADLSSSQTSPQSDSERSSDSETGLLTGTERRSILLERLKSYFFELFSSCHSPVPITKAGDLQATPTLPSTKIPAPDTDQQYRQGRIYSSHDNHDRDESATTQISAERDRETKTPERRSNPLPSNLPVIITWGTMSQRAPREDGITSPPLPISKSLDPPTNRHPPLLQNYEPKRSFFYDENDNNYPRSNGQDKNPKQNRSDSGSVKSNISASSAVSVNKGSNASFESTRSSQKRDRDGDDGDKDDRESNKRTRLSDNRSTATKRLACPYFKKDPEHPRLGRSCSGPGWGTVHRIKCVNHPVSTLHASEQSLTPSMYPESISIAIMHFLPAASAVTRLSKQRLNATTT